MKGISKKLQDIINEAKPKRGQSVIFEVLKRKTDPVTKKVIVPTSVAIPSLCKIWDPWGGDGNGCEVNLEFVEREVPNPDPNSLRASFKVMGRISFLRELAGSIAVSGDNKALDATFEYLFLCPYNQSNIGKEWYIQPLDKPKYKLVDHKVDLASKEAYHLIRKQADRLIDEMSDVEIEVVFNEVKSKIDLAHAAKTVNEKRTLLSEFVQVKENAQRILTLSKDNTVEVKKYISKAKTLKLIEVGVSQNDWVWSDGKERICVVLEGVKPEESLRKYFITEEGANVLKTLIGIVDAKEAEKIESNKK